MNSEVRSHLLRYGAAVAVIALATWLRILADPVLGPRVPYLTYFLAVIAAAWYGGLGPGLLSLALGALAASHFFLPPEGSLLPAVTADWVSLALFLAMGTAIVQLCHSRRCALRRAEVDALRILEERRRFEVTLASIGDGVVVTDPKGRVTFLNPVAEELTGWTQHDALTKPLEQVFQIVSEAGEPAENPALRALREGTIVGLANHTVLIAKDGTRRFIDDSAAPIREHDGAVCGVVLVFRDVTARRAAERAFRESQALKAAIVETALDCIITIDHRGRLLEFNAAAEETFGYRRADVLGKPMAELIVPPSHRESHYQGLARFLETGEGPVLGKRILMPALRADGREIPVELAIMRVPGEDPPVFTAYVRDVTEPLRVEQRRAARLAATQILAQEPDVEQALRGVLKSICTALGWSTGCVWTLDERDRVLRCRDVWRRPDDQLAPFEEITREITFARGVGLPGRAWESGKAVWIVDVLAEANFPRASCAEQTGLRGALACPVQVGGAFFGVIEFFSQELQPPDDDLLEMIATIGSQVGQFIERRRAEEQLRQSERLYRAIGESIDYGVWVCDPTGRNIYTSESFLKLVGLTQEQCSDFGWGDVLHPDDAERTLEAWKQCVQTEGVWDIEHRFRGVDGQYHLVLARGVPVRDEEGRITCWAGINLDISRLKEAEAALHEADRRKNEFLAMLAHELRNPLTPLRSGLDVLALESEGAHETVTLMQEQVEHLVRLVDDLLDVSRIVRGKIELRRQPTDLCAVVRRAAAGAKSAVRDREQEIALVLPQDPVYVDADAVRLVQVVGNLLHNASKYSDPQSPIELRLEAEGGEAILRVRDEGIGIEPELLPRVFDLFTQSDNSRDRARGGLGIGLTLVRDLVAMHGGTVSAQSEGPGRGSEFVVRLPTTEARPHTPRPPQAEPMRRSLAIGRRILVVDDNVAAAKMLSMLLAGLGPHQVEVAHSGPAALAKAPHFRPEIVLLDIGMPRMNGFEVCRAMRQRPECRDALLVAVSGYGQEEDRRRAREAGFDEHMVKPPSRADIQRVLAHRRLHESPPAVAASSREGAGGVPVASAAPAVEPPSVPTPPLEERTGQFLRELAHDAGNAVYPFRLMLHILEQRGLNENGQERLVQSLRSQLPQMDRVLNQLRRAGAVIRGDVAPQPRSLEAAPALRAAAEAVRPLAEKHGQHLDLELSEPLPPLWADPELLQQALEELLQNAIQNTGRDGRIILSAEPEDGRVCIRVRDTGRGIDPELLPRVFEPFVRGEGKLDFQGDRLGLGLAQVKRIVARHGGSVTARSPGPGEGAEFIVRWPTSQPQPAS